MGAPMPTDREGVVREFHHLVADFRPLAHDPPHVGFKAGSHDLVVQPDLLQIGPPNGKGDDERAQSLFSDWLAELVAEDDRQQSKHIDYRETASAYIFAILDELARTKAKVVEQKKHEFCPWCDRSLTSGAPRAQVEAQREEAEKIKKELGLR